MRTVARICARWVDERGLDGSIGSLGISSYIPAGNAMVVYG